MGSLKKTCPNSADNTNQEPEDCDDRQRNAHRRVKPALVVVTNIHLCVYDSNHVTRLHVHVRSYNYNFFINIKIMADTARKALDTAIARNR